MSKIASGSPEGFLEKKEPVDRKECLRLALPTAVELLRTRQAGLIEAADIDEYVALHWLEWHGGTLRLTVTGSNVCSQLPSARRYD